VHELFVIARNSTFTHKGNPVDVRPFGHHPARSVVQAALARRVDLVFRPGENVLIRASLIAYNTHLNDLQDVAVSTLREARWPSAGKRCGPADEPAAYSR
jgi:hypothetical protein